MLTKEIEMPREIYDIANEEYDCKFTNGRIKIKRFLVGETNSISRDATKIRAQGLTLNLSVDIDPMDVNELTVKLGVLEAPWAINDINAVKSLPPIVFEWILKEIGEFNTINYKKKES